MGQQAGSPGTMSSGSGLESGASTSVKRTGATRKDTDKRRPTQSVLGVEACSRADRNGCCSTGGSRVARGRCKRTFPFGAKAVP